VITRNNRFVLLLFGMFCSFQVLSDDLKEPFIEICEGSPFVEDGTDCACVYNEVVFQFGADDAEVLMPMISGDEKMDAEVQSSFSFIVGKCDE